MSRGHYRKFVEARALVRELGFESAGEYFAWSSGRVRKSMAKPADIPSNPHQVYRDEWISFSDYLGTARVATYRRKFLSFEEAREFARALGLSTYTEWRSYAKGELIIPGMSPRPSCIPSNPNATYKLQGWVGIADWLGCGEPAPPALSRFCPFAEAREFARSLRLEGWLEWRRFVRGELSEVGLLPADIPAIPHAAYQGSGWLNYGDWLGTGSRAHLKFQAVEEAVKFTATLRLKNVQAWREYCCGEIEGLPGKPVDIDVKGLLIPLAATLTLLADGYSPLLPQTGCYARAMDLATNVALPVSTSTQIPDGARDWLGPQLAESVQSWLSRGIRIPQELVGWEDLHDNGDKFLHGELAPGK